MKMTIVDKSNFLRGFLILIRKDKALGKHEKKMAVIIGKHFGFAEDFCDTALDELLENEYISEDPPVFSNQPAARFFVEECKNILSQIHELSNEELEWLEQVEIANKLKLESVL
jgi:hypothetical protein